MEGWQGECRSCHPSCQGSLSEVLEYWCTYLPGMEGWRGECRSCRPSCPASLSEVIEYCWYLFTWNGRVMGRVRKLSPLLSSWAIRKPRSWCSPVRSISLASLVRSLQIQNSRKRNEEATGVRPRVLSFQRDSHKILFEKINSQTLFFS